MAKKLGRTVRGPKTSKGIFCGHITARVEPEIHEILYKEALRKNMTISLLVADKVLAQMDLERLELRRRIWTSSECMKRKFYTLILFTNNIDNNEVCFQLCGQYQEHDDTSDKDHKISDYINRCLEFDARAPIPACEFVLNENNEKELKEHGV